MSKNEVSDDLQRLQSMVVMDAPGTKGRWQIFGTPEDLGGVPGPTDYITLIAEFENISSSWMEKQSGNPGEVWVAPESPRDWLRPENKAMFEKAKKNVIDLSTRSDCHPYKATMKRSGRPVDGFTCTANGIVLLYLTLSNPPSAESPPEA